MIDDFVGQLRDEIDAQIKYSIMGFSQGNKLALNGVAGSGGGTGSPIGGIVGQLAQRYITYDTSEAATLSGETSLVDNLNHMRYRLHVLESTPAVGTFIDLTDTPESYTGYGKYYLAVKESENGVEFIPITAGGGGNSNPIFKAEGYVDVASGIDIAYLCTTSGTINNISTYVETVSGTLILDVNKNMTTIFTTQENRPTITEAGVDASLTPDITTFASGDIFTVDIDTVGEASNLIAVINLTTASGVSELVYWNDILSKPETFAPSAHTHLWAEITDPPATYTPSSHTHTESEITDLDHDAVKLQGVNISTDTPVSGELLTYDGTNWIPSGITLTTDFLSLTDTPSSYSGQAGKYLVVASGENSVEFANMLAELPDVFMHYDNYVNNPSYNPGPVWMDKSGRGVHLVSSGENYPTISGCNGKTVMYFDGVDDNLYNSVDTTRISVPRHQLGMTVVTWVKVVDVHKEQHIIHRDYSYDLYCTESGNLHFKMWGTGGHQDIETPQQIEEGSWNMLWANVVRKGDTLDVSIKLGINNSYTEIASSFINAFGPYQSFRILSLGCRNVPAEYTSPNSLPTSYTSDKFLNGCISETYLCGDKVTTDDIYNYYQYTRGKYGV